MGVEWCSVVILCFGAFAGMSAIALVAIGSSTDHWTFTHVNRTSVAEHGESSNTGYMFHSRHRGLFRTCFLESDRPPEDTPGLYLSIMEDWCYTRNYELDGLLKGEMRPHNITDHANTHLQLLRVTPVLLFAYLFSMCMIGVVGLCGCWQQSSDKLITTAIFQLLSALVGACAMATFHAALLYEMQKVHDPGFRLSWPEWLQENSSHHMGWSYVVTWLGICLALVSSLLTSGSAICLRSHKRKFEDNSLRMKLQLSRMFAQHAYFPGSQNPTPRDYPTMPANYPTKHFIGAYEEREEIITPVQNDSRRPFLHGSSEQLRALRGSSEQLRALRGSSEQLRHLRGGPPGSGQQGRGRHSRESSELSDTYQAEEYRNMVNQLQDSRF